MGHYLQAALITSAQMQPGQNLVTWLHQATGSGDQEMQHSFWEAQCANCSVRVPRYLLNAMLCVGFYKDYLIFCFVLCTPVVFFNSLNLPNFFFC